MPTKSSIISGAISFGMNLPFLLVSMMTGAITNSTFDSDESDDGGSSYMDPRTGRLISDGRAGHIIPPGAIARNIQVSNQEKMGHYLPTAPGTRISEIGSRKMNSIHSCSLIQGSLPTLPGKGGAAGPLFLPPLTLQIILNRLTKSLNILDCLCVARIATTTKTRSRRRWLTTKGT